MEDKLEASESTALILLRSAIDEIRKACWTDPADVSDQEALGVLVSKFTEWTPFDILTVSIHALEDSNWHTGADELEKLQGRLVNGD